MPTSYNGRLRDGVFFISLRDILMAKNIADILRDTQIHNLHLESLRFFPMGVPPLGLYKEASDYL